MRSPTAGSPSGRRRPGGPAPTRLPGLTVPGLANCHSHAFHRALRGRTQRGSGHVLDLARADVRPRRAARPRHLPRRSRRRSSGRWRPAGITAVGRVPLPAPPARRLGVRRPERDGRSRSSRPRARPGVRIALLDTCYLAAGIGPSGRGRAAPVLATAPPRPGRSGPTS